MDQTMEIAAVQEKEECQKNFELRNVVLEKEDERDHNDYFCLNCLCQCCIEYRDVILEIWDDQLKTQNLWINVRSIIRNFYQPLLKTNSENQDNYKKLISKSPNWIICGHINKNKTKYLDLTSDLSLTDYMKLVLYSSILVDDDPQQFFELISYEIECVVRAYGSGLTKLISGKSYSPKDVLIYVLNGYFELIKINDHVSSFLFSFESNHLKKFSCSLLLLTKKMYEYWLYVDFVDIMPECLIKLKTEIDQSECEHLIPEYITFDEDMILTNTLWEYVWLRIDSYNNSENEQVKGVEMNLINQMFDVLAKSTKKDEANKIWGDLVAHVQENWITRNNEKIYFDQLNLTKCNSCSSRIFDHIRNCRCNSCKIAGVPTVLEELMPSDNHSMCSTCVLTGGKTKMTPIDVDEIRGEIPKIYHYSWAVFKHLRGRSPYRYKNIDENMFCKDCNSTSCLLAVKILNNEVPNNVAQYLIKNYQPFNLSNDEIAEMIPKIWLYNKRLNSLPPSDYLNIDQIGNIFWRFIVSSYASCFAQTDYQQSQSKEQLLQINYDNLKIQNNDIHLDVSNIKLNGKPNKLLEFIQSIIKEKNIMNDLNKVQNSIQNSLQSVNFDKICCNDNESPTNCKKVNPNNKRVCFHSNECKHTRKSQTRDRLRLKLKNIKPELKSTMNEQLCNNSTGNVCKQIGSNKKVIAPVEKPSPSCEIKKDRIEKTLNISKVEIEKIKKPLPIEEPIKLKPSVPDNSINKWVKDALSFIEGSNSSSNFNCPENSKKAAKKAKQKQKKEESKHIEELQDLRDQFYDIYFKEFELKTELKDLKSLKKKDKKRLQDVEGNIKKFNKAKSKIENYILEGIATVKVINPEFKFSYLPTKEQQQKYLKEKNNLQTSQKNGSNQVSETQNPLLSSYVASACYNGGDCIPGSGRNFQISQNEPEDEGASKRIVTIRRINLPNSNEPQVTVTAKGERPDSDKLLYTFVNGQLVPANNVNSNKATFSIPSNYLSNFYGTNYTQPTNYMQQHQQQTNEKCSSVAGNSITSCNEKKKTKTQIKKEKQLRKKLKSEADFNVETKDQATNSSKVKSDYKTPSEAKEVEDKTNNKKPDKKSKLKEIKNSINSNKNDTEEANSENEAAITNLEQIKSKNCSESLKKINKNNKRKDYSLVLQNNQFNVLGLDENDGDSTENEFSPENSDTEIKLVEKNVPNKVMKKKKDQINDTINKKPSVNLQTEVVKKLPPNSDKKEIQNKNKNNKKNELTNKSNNSKNKNLNLNDKLKVENKNKITKNISKSHKNIGESQQYNTIQSNLNINSLQASMNDMYISEAMKANSSMSKNISIMDQLKQGIQVENLTLPPGITLTRIDPAKVEAIKAKTKTIEKLSKPLEKQPPQQRIGIPTNPLISDYIPHMSQSFASFASNEVIMVDTVMPKNNAKDKLKQPQIDTKQQQGKKNKKKKNKAGSANSEIFINSDGNKKSKTSSGSKLITLKNPMFDVNNLQNLDLKGHLPNYPQTVNHDSPSATIFKNENGMFTIRNSALHESIESANANNIQRQYSNPNSIYLNNIYNTNFPPSQINYSNSYGKDLSLDNENTVHNKNISAIGSEIKNAQQNKTNNNSFNNDSYWPHSMSQLSMNGMAHQNQRYNQNHNFRNDIHEDPFPNSNYNFSNKDNYNDVSYLDKLIMDQHLNDEVTIHNIKDVKFKSNRNLIDVDHKIDITPIPTKEPQYNGYSSMYNLTGCSSNLSANKGLNYEFENSNFLFNNGRTSQTPTNHSENAMNDFVNEMFYNNMNSLKIDDNNVAGHDLKTTPNTWW